MIRLLLFLCLLLLPVGAQASACGELRGLVGPARPGFVPSYPTAPPGVLHNAAYLYDTDAAILGLIACHDRARALVLGQALLWAQEHDRFWHDGRLRNAYRAGPPSDPVALPGWWDDRQKHWLEDRYQVGSDSGNMAWTLLALLALDDGRDPRFRAAALKLAGWMGQWLDDKAPAGFTGATLGFEPVPDVRTWKSTEQNTDLAAAFTLLAARDADPRWRRYARTAAAFVAAMWRPACGCFAAGTGPDGATLNPTLALDAQVWPPTALPALRAKPVWPLLDRVFAIHGGMAYGPARDGLWSEGTAQAALLARLVGQTDRYHTLMAALARQQAPGGGDFATDAPALPTGFMLESDPSRPRLYFHLPHLGATAWAALAETGWNPFTLGK
ncbi:hypothetical protein GALL_79800 [mine drainage metagenome]|uniref:Uncharacterized protein n=1 Tax=mine drainage metagenome TaxID=410659 RepID=A0A1J5T1D0_9ZZZZ